MFNNILLASLLFTVSLFAETKDKWRINIGDMLVTDFSTQMQIGHSDRRLSALIDTDNTLGLKEETNVFRLDGYYRFNEKHSIDFSYFRVKSNGERTTNREFDWNDYTIGANASVQSYFNMSVYKLNYGYSFYHNEKVELMLTAGLHMTSIDLGLSAQGTITDNNGNVIASLNNESESTTLPLPVFGFKGEYTIINDALFVSFKTEVFALKFEDYSGSLATNTLQFDYRFYKGYGIGIGYNVNNIKVEHEGSGTQYKVENNLAGAMLNLSYTY